MTTIPPSRVPRDCAQQVASTITNTFIQHYLCNILFSAIDYIQLVILSERPVGAGSNTATAVLAF